MQLASKENSKKQQVAGARAPDYSRFHLKIDWLRELMTGIIITAWVVLAVQTIVLSMEGASAAYGAGMGLFDALNLQLGRAADGFGAFVLSLCAPAQTLSFPLALMHTFLMWQLMVFAMMLPGVMSIFDPAKSQSKPKSQMVLLSLGFVLAWSVFSLIAAGLQLTLQHFGHLTDGFVLQDWRLGLAVICFAVYYPLSLSGRRDLHHCNVLLRKLNHSQIIDHPFFEGMHLGKKCIRCCWPMMLAMFGFGVMNILAMGVFTLLLIYQRRQKQLPAVNAPIGV